MLALRPYNKKGNLCIDDCIMSVADYFHKNYIYMYTKGLHFTYFPKIQRNESVLNCIRTSSIYPVSEHNLQEKLQYLQDFVGLRIDVKPNIDISKNELVDFIRKNIRRDIPIGIFLNTYWTPWHTAYFHKVHMPHSFLIIDINDREEYLLCMDGVLCDQPVRLPFKNLFLCTGLISFNPIEPRVNLNFYNVISQIVGNLYDNEKLYSCDCIRAFSRDIGKLNFKQEEKNLYRDLNISPFMFGLKSVEFSRKNMADMFGYMSEQFRCQKQELLSMQSKLNAIARQWEIVIVYLIKGFYSNQFFHYRNMAAELLLTIADEEEAAASALLTLLEKNAY